MEEMPKLSREQFIERMRIVFEESLGKVADAINDAPSGSVIAASEEPVRDLFTEFRRRAYELGLQMRIDAAEAAFSPSEGSDDRTQQTQQGT